MAETVTAPPPDLAAWLQDELGIVTNDVEGEPLDVRLAVILKCDHEVAYGDWPYEEYERITLALAGTISPVQDEGIHHYVSATRASTEDMLNEVVAVIKKRNTTREARER
jgi:hypothetical protein